MLDILFVIWPIFGIISFFWANNFIYETNEQFRRRSEFKIPVLAISPIAGPFLAIILFIWGLKLQNGGFHFGLRFKIWE